MEKLETDARILYGVVGGLPLEDEQAFYRAMESMQELFAEGKIGLECPMEQMPAEVAEELFGCREVNDACDFDEWCKFVSGFGERTQATPVPQFVVGCLPSHKLARLFRNMSKSALWGGDSGEGFAAVYPDRVTKYVVWHEVLHLCGAKDCYCWPDRGPSCGKRNCIMQHNPNNTDGVWPFICDKNLERLKEQLGGSASPD